MVIMVITLSTFRITSHSTMSRTSQRLLPNSKSVLLVLCSGSIADLQLIHRLVIPITREFQVLRKMLRVLFEALVKSCSELSFSQVQNELAPSRPCVYSCHQEMSCCDSKFTFARFVRKTSSDLPFYVEPKNPQVVSAARLIVKCYSNYKIRFYFIEWIKSAVFLASSGLWNTEGGCVEYSL